MEQNEVERRVSSWTYEIDVTTPGRLHLGAWKASFGMVERSGDEYLAYVYLEGRRYRLAESFVSAPVAQRAAERTWKREMAKRGVQNG